jgi:hypothetical protein
MPAASALIFDGGLRAATLGEPSIIENVEAQTMQGTIHKYGERLLIDLPIELARALGWGMGDVLSIDQTETGLKIERALTADDHVTQLASQCMDEYRETFEKLAKS